MSNTSIDERSRSKPHRRVERILDKLKISYMSEHAEFPPYALDIYLPEVHAAIEVDGPTHSKAKDKKRDGNLLASYGVPVLHLPVEEFSPQHLEITILSFIKHSGKSAGERKLAWLEESNL